MSLGTFLGTLASNPAVITAFSNPYALGAEETVFLESLKTALGEGGMGAPFTSNFISSDALENIVDQLGACQREEPDTYSRAVRRAKAEAKIKVGSPPPPSAPLPLAAFIHEIEILQSISPALAIPRLQAVLQYFHGIRSSLTEPDWSGLEATAQTPLEVLFVRFIKGSPSLSPLHWARFLKEAENRPPNPVVTIGIGKMNIEGMGNWVIPEPGVFSVLSGTSVYFSGFDIRLMATVDRYVTVNGENLSTGVWHRVRRGDRIAAEQTRLDLQVDFFQYEVPLTLWPVYLNTESDFHPHAFQRADLIPGRSQKYVVVRRPGGDYAMRVAAAHHYQMIGERDIFIAGGWMFVNEENEIVLDGNTVRFGHVMKDDFYFARILLAAQLLRNSGHSVTVRAG